MDKHIKYNVYVERENADGIYGVRGDVVDRGVLTF